MRVIRSISDMQSYSLSQRRQGQKIAFVPTMGSLHAGHMSLVKVGKKEADILVLSIFVNQMQFGPSEDFEQYPRDFEADEALCREHAVDIIFYPESKDIFPKDFQTKVSLSHLTENLCGKSRPTHFDGVTTIVCKLLNIVQANIAIFGQKDFQQFRIIQQMQTDLNIPTQIKMAEITREEDGLALSSRNRYLSKKDRKAAPVLFQALKKAEVVFLTGERNVTAIRSCIEKEFETVDCKIDYIDIVRTKDLKAIKDIKKDALIAIAVYFGKTRLIDNIILGKED